MMWLVNTQRFTRMMSTRSRVHNRAGVAAVFAGATVGEFADLCKKIPPDGSR